METFQQGNISVGSTSFTLLPQQQLICKIWGATVTTSSTQCYIPIGKNPIQLMFHNPDNSGNVIWFCKALSANGTPQNAVVPSAGTGGSMLMLIPGGFMTFNAPGTGAWNCIALAESEITIIEITPSLNAQ